MTPPVSSKAASKKTSDTTNLNQSSGANQSLRDRTSFKQAKSTSNAHDSSADMANSPSNNPSEVTASGTASASTDTSRLNAINTINSNIRRHTPNRAPNFQTNTQPVYQNSDRIAIFIDGSNLFYAASHLNIEVDYRRLLTTLVGGRRLLRAYFYTGVDPQNEKQRGFLLWLNRHGHRVVSKELAHLPDGSRKANMHVEMAVDMMRISDYCSTLTLLGGDGNLSYALQVLSQRGISLEVVSLQSMTSDSLIDLADVYTDLADLRDDIKR
ncbi:MAG: NYN domain-containing protein [Phormidesmis sp.]